MPSYVGHTVIINNAIGFANVITHPNRLAGDIRAVFLVLPSGFECPAPSSAWRQLFNSTDPQGYRTQLFTSDSDQEAVFDWEPAGNVAALVSSATLRDVDLDDPLAAAPAFTSGTTTTARAMASSAVTPDTPQSLPWWFWSFHASSGGTTANITVPSPLSGVPGSAASRPSTASGHLVRHGYLDTSPAAGATVGPYTATASATSRPWRSLALAWRQRGVRPGHEPGRRILMAT